MIDELTSMLRERGAALVGFADLGALAPEPRHGLPFGVSIAVALTPSIVAAIPEGPSQDYADEYDSKNALLNELAEAAAELLAGCGCRAVASEATLGPRADPARPVPLPHKTVATRAGLGWIGKCALLVTRQFGPAVRLGAVLTDAPLPVGEPIDESHCGNCTACVDVCPGSAVKGRDWQVGMAREELFDPFACREAQQERRAAAGVTKTGCGLCIALCPFTREYLKRMGTDSSV